MEIATEEDTLRFLEGLWFRHGQLILNKIMKLYNVTEEQREILENTILRPNDWSVEVEEALRQE